MVGETVLSKTRHFRHHEFPRDRTMKQTAITVVSTPRIVEALPMHMSVETYIMHVK